MVLTWSTSFFYFTTRKSGAQEVIEMTSNNNPLYKWLKRTGCIGLFRNVGELKDIRLSTCWKEQDFDVC
jgi:hypothetical protein